MPEQGSPSEEEVLRDQYAAVNERDFERAMSHYADDVVLVITGSGIRSGTFEGREAVGNWFGDWLRTFERGARFDEIEISEAEDGRLLLVTAHHARGRASGVEVEAKIRWLYRLRNGKIVHVEGNGEFLHPLEAPADA